MCTRTLLMALRSVTGAQTQPRARIRVLSQLPVSQQAGMLGSMKVTFDIDSDLYRSVRVEAARADRSIREVVAEALAGWLEAREDDEDRASAADALAEYERDGGAAAVDFFEHLAAEARAEYGSRD